MPTHVYASTKCVRFVCKFYALYCRIIQRLLSVACPGKLVDSTHLSIDDMSPGRSTSNSSLNSMSSPECDVHFRLCAECRTLLERRDRTVAERHDKPVITLLYEVVKQ